MCPKPTWSRREQYVFIKLFNIEKQGPTRTVLNHFNRVGGQHPVGFLEDLIAEQIPGVVLKASSKTVSARSPSTSRLRLETIETLPVPGYTAVPEGSPFALDQNAECARPTLRLCQPVESTYVLPVLYQTAKPARPLDVVNQRLLASVPSLNAPQLRLSGANKVSPASAQSSSNQGQDFMDIGLGPGRVASDALIMCGSVCGQLENSPVVYDCEPAGRCSLELTPEKECTILHSLSVIP